jgi:hypothetical protein
MAVSDHAFGQPHSASRFFFLSILGVAFANGGYGAGFLLALSLARFHFQMNCGFGAGFRYLSLLLALSLSKTMSVSLPTEWRLCSGLSSTECIRLYCLFIDDAFLPAAIVGLAIVSPETV